MRMFVQVNIEWRWFGTMNNKARSKFGDDSMAVFKDFKRPNKKYIFYMSYFVSIVSNYFAVVNEY